MTNLIEIQSISTWDQFILNCSVTSHVEPMMCVVAAGSFVPCLLVLNGFSVQATPFFYMTAKSALTAIWGVAGSVALMLTAHYFTSVLHGAIIKLVGLLVTIAYYTLAERKIMASVQRRRGPNVVGFDGLLQPLADGLKLLAKELVVPAYANSRIFTVAPLAVLLLALVSWSVVPFTLFDHSETVPLRDLLPVLMESIPDAGGTLCVGLLPEIAEFLYEQPPKPFRVGWHNGQPYWRIAETMPVDFTPIRVPVIKGLISHSLGF